MKIRSDVAFAAHDESPHFASPVEWWFVQGMYRSAGAGVRHFMAALLRHQGIAPGPDPEDSYSLLLSVLDPETGRNEILSQINPAMVDFFVRLVPKIAKTNLDARMVAAYVDEVSSYGPPRPIHAAAGSPLVHAGPFCASWEDFEIAVKGRHLELRFVEPESRRACRFRLRPLLPRFQIEDITFQDEKFMDYALIPGMELQGSIDGKPARGEAWFDHQWGSHSQFAANSKRLRLLGWTWFGVSLEDGRHIMAISHGDARHGTTVKRYAVLMAPGRRPRICHAYSAKPLRHWESEKTRTRYPISWQLDFPEFRTRLRFDPLADDQEIPVLGAQRAIWEGAGTVSATVDGRPVNGRARLELTGHGDVFDVEERVRKLVRRVDERILEYFPKTLDEPQLRRYVGIPNWKHEAGAYSAVLSRPVWDLMERRGKHWRPIFGLLMLEALGIPSRPFETLMSVVAELSHTGALIIDDIEDDSHLRRGGKCIHLRYGLDVAINAANTAYFLPYLLLRDHPVLSGRQRLALYRILSEQSVRSHFGQGMDIFWSRKLTERRLKRWMSDSLSPKILQTYAYKTGALLEGLAEAAAVIARADAATRKACGSFATTFGVAFQIVDDVLGLTEPRKLRKKSGEDIARGKITYAMLRAFERLPTPECRRLQAIFCSPELRSDPATLEEAVALVRRSGSLEACRQEALAMVDQAWARLARKLAPSEPRTMLRALCTHLLV